jgi:hypothetical protein
MGLPESNSVIRPFVGLADLTEAVKIRFAPAATFAAEVVSVTEVAVKGVGPAILPELPVPHPKTKQRNPRRPILDAHSWRL